MGEAHWRGGIDPPWAKPAGTMEPTNQSIGPSRARAQGFRFGPCAGCLPYPEYCTGKGVPWSPNFGTPSPRIDSSCRCPRECFDHHRCPLKYLTTAPINMTTATTAKKTNISFTWKSKQHLELVIHDSLRLLRLFACQLTHSRHMHVHSSEFESDCRNRGQLLPACAPCLPPLGTVPCTRL